MNIEKFLTCEDITIEDALKIIDANGYGVVYVVDGDILRGVVTDGNIRRYILKEHDIHKSIRNVINYKCHSITDFNGEISKFMKQHRILSVPVVDSENRIVKIYFSNGNVAEYYRNIDIPVVIMAGGKGTRLHPYTNILPKPLIPIGEKTITEHIMDRFEHMGCKQFYMIVNYKRNLIKTFFRESDDKRDIQFIDEEQFMGTGGGLRLLKDKMESTFFMTNCDILVEEDYGPMLEYHNRNHNIVTMVCAEKVVEIPYGTVEVGADGNAKGLHEKPEFKLLTNTGLYILEPAFLKKIPENTFVHITDIIQQLIEEGEKVGVYTVNERAWMDMGQVDELEQMRKKIVPNM